MSFITNLSIKTSLLTIISVLLVGVLTFASLGVYASYEARIHDEKIIVMNHLSDLLFENAGNLAVERGFTNAAIGSENPADNAVRSQIQQRREVADQALSAAIAELRAAPMFANQEDPISALESAYSRLNQLRQTVDSALALPAGERPDDLSATWVSTATDVILRSRDLRVALSSSQGVDSLIGELTSLRHFAWTMSEYAGRERALVGGAIGAGRVLDHRTLEILNAYRGQVELARDTVLDLAQDIKLPESVTDAVRMAQDSYFGSFQATREAVLGAGISSAAYPLTSGEWIQEATAAIDSILDVQNAIADSWSALGIAPEANRLTARLIDAAGNWAVERGATLAAINATEAIGGDTRRLIEERRDTADAAFRASIAQLSVGWSFDGKDQALIALQDAYDSVAALRNRIDDQLALPADAREAGLADLWATAITDLITMSQSLRVDATRPIGLTDPQVAALLAAKHSAWVMNEYAGRERAIVGGVIASAAHFSNEQERRLSEYRGWVESAWSSLQDFTRSSFATSAVEQAVARTNETFFTQYDAVRNSIYAAEADSAAYPMTAAQWITASTAAIDTLLEIEHAAGAATNSVAEQDLVSQTTILIIEAVILLMALAMAVGSFWIIAKRVVQPLYGMTAAMADISSGKLDVEVPSADRRDEIGQMAKALQIFKDNLFETERLREAQEAAEVKAAEERAQAMMELADFFEHTVKEVVNEVANISSDVRRTAEELVRSADETSERSTTVAAASEEATTNVQSVSSAATELASSVQEISQRVGESSTISNIAAGKARQINEDVGQLAEAAERIGEVIGLISDIAEQTNLLALNATIESARAGEAGKGFAVVAHEVKSLASETAMATGDISRHVRDIQGATQKAVLSIKEIAATIEQVNENATGIASAVEEQGAATQEISRSIEEAASGTKDVTQNIAVVSQTAADAGQSAGSMLSTSEMLNERSTQLGQEVDGFLVRVRESAMGNRRQHQRYKGSWTATGGGAAAGKACKIKDLSLGGALVDSAVELSAGVDFELSIQGVDCKIAAHVVAVDDAGTHIKFADDEDVRAAIQSLLDRDVKLAA